MQKLRTKKGFSLVEVVCSLALFLVLFLCAASIETSVNKLKEKNTNEKKYTDILKLTGDSLNYNVSFSECKALKNMGKLYINKENLDYDLLSSINIEAVLEEEIKSSDVYLKVSIEGINVHKVTLTLYYKESGRIKNLCYEFYKGSYR